MTLAIGTKHICDSFKFLRPEPTVLYISAIPFQRIKIRCYNIFRGYAPFHTLFTTVPQKVAVMNYTLFSVIAVGFNRRR